MDTENTASPKRQGRPPKKLQDTAEFKAALESAKDSIMADLMGEIKGLAHMAQPELAPDNSMMRQLALSIAELTDQGSGRKRVPPEVMRAREDSRVKMETAIMAAHDADYTATYRVKSKTLLADQVVEPFYIDNHHTAQPTIIDWAGVPNDAMEPVNVTAQEIYSHYMGWLGSMPTDAPRIQAQLALTAKGLVVHGGATSISNGRRMVGGNEVQGNSPAVERQEAGLNVHHRDLPGRFTEKRVLGSIAAPAQQSI